MGTNFSMFHHDFDYVTIRCIQVNIKADMKLIFIRNEIFMKRSFAHCKQKEV